MICPKCDAEKNSHHSQDTLRGVRDGVLQIGIVEDDVGTLSSELEGNFLANQFPRTIASYVVAHLEVTVSGLLEDLLPDCGRTGESDLVDLVRRRKRITDGGAVTECD